MRGDRGIGLHGATIAACCLGECDATTPAPQQLRRWERKAQAGLMVLWDGSRHDWLQGRGPYLSLVGAIDDATGELLPGAHFVEQECAAGYLRVVQAITRSKGVPWSMYYGPPWRVVAQ